MNRIPQFLKQVTNQQRAARPGVKVNPVDSGADKETAKVFQGLIRHIETKTDADIAYSHGGEDQVTMGRGYWRIRTVWADDYSFKQEIKIEPVWNPLTVYCDTLVGDDDSSPGCCGRRQASDHPHG